MEKVEYNKLKTIMLSLIKNSKLEFFWYKFDKILLWNGNWHKTWKFLIFLGDMWSLGMAHDVFCVCLYVRSLLKQWTHIAIQRFNMSSFVVVVVVLFLAAFVQWEIIMRAVGRRNEEKWNEYVEVCVYSFSSSIWNSKVRVEYNPSYSCTHMYCIHTNIAAIDPIFEC